MSVAAELVGVDVVDEELRGARGEGRLWDGLRLGLAPGEEAAQAGVLGGAGVQGCLEVIGPHGLLFGPDALGDGLHVLLPGVPGEAGAGEGE
ncbi:MAG: hypothetical protein KDD75_06270 [Caldilineaceae bacterium]|nr:hypothetical protein [Caldilineaceae bacterium]